MGFHDRFLDRRRIERGADANLEPRDSGGSSHGRHLDGRGEASGSEAESGVILYVFVG